MLLVIGNGLSASLYNECSARYEFKGSFVQIFNVYLVFIWPSASLPAYQESYAFWFMVTLELFKESCFNKLESTRLFTTCTS